ncbi:MAG: ATP-dependent DNA helicase RecG [Campylobacterales bacterium]|nr:ATP-dependent DNA helicase RecG [Campylobacterales bacterium]
MQPSNPKDAKDFSKLGVTSLLDLALYLPHHHDNHCLTSTPTLGEVVVALTCKGLARHAKTLHVKAWCETWQKEVRGVIFNPKPFHFALFKEGETCVVSAKAEFGFGVWQLVQPKVIQVVGVVVPRYKTPLQNARMIALVRAYVHEDKLMEAGLNAHETQMLTALHGENQDAIALRKEPYFLEHVVPVLKRVEVLNHLQKLLKKKRYFKASATLNSPVEPFVKRLPFVLTEDQKRVIGEIREDFAKAHAAKRVIMGDVGCGKTMVILASMVMAYPKKSLLMVPTTILAVQIFKEAQRFLPPSMRLALVTSATKEGTLEEADCIIGTHALLFEPLPQCDLVMVDEQHRFGTKQREGIKKLTRREGTHPHFLQFTATPIPRTLSMMNATLVDYSFIKQMPFVKKITTSLIGKADFKQLLKHIEKEVALGHQVAIIYPLTQESEAHTYQSLEEGREFWEKRFERVYVTHGKDKDKEAILAHFAKEGNILLATTVVEVGISLPKLSTIVIVGAEHLGLASLHQLRGRVSRTGLEGYCFLFTYKEASKRLEDFTRTLDGFEIAELDLKYRRSGDVLSGDVQHGDQFVWFDMACDGEILEEIKKRVGA